MGKWWLKKDPKNYEQLTLIDALFPSDEPKPGKAEPAERQYPEEVAIEVRSEDEAVKAMFLGLWGEMSYECGNYHVAKRYDYLHDNYLEMFANFKVRKLADNVWIADEPEWHKKAIIKTHGYYIETYYDIEELTDSQPYRFGNLDDCKIWLHFPAMCIEFFDLDYKPVSIFDQKFKAEIEETFPYEEYHARDNNNFSEGTPDLRDLAEKKWLGGLDIDKPCDFMKREKPNGRFGIAFCGSRINLSDYLNWRDAKEA